MDTNGLIARAASLSGFVRMSQLPFLFRRAIGFPALDREAFARATDRVSVDHLATIAHTVRGEDYRPALFVHGVLPRSGTNFLADALALHPHTAQNPGELWEFPLLYVSNGADALQREFQFMFRPNERVMKRHQMLAYLASGWMCDLQSSVGDRAMLFKSPHVQHLALFSAIFPRDRLLILLRDGRDVLQSSIATFGRRLMDKSFSAMASEWAAATQLALAFEPGGALASENALVVRYEDLVRDGRATMERVLAHSGLDPALYDWQRFENLPLRGSSTSRADTSEKWKQEPRARDFNPLGRWREWPDARKKHFKKMAGETLIAAGYARDLDW